MEPRELELGQTVFFRGSIKITYHGSYDVRLNGTKRKYYRFASANLGPFGLTRSEVKENLGTKRIWS